MLQEQLKDEKVMEEVKRRIAMKPHLKKAKVAQYFLDNPDLTLRQIGKDCGVTTQYVSKVLKQMGVNGKAHRKVERSKKDDELRVEFLDIFNSQDVTREEIAKLLNVSESKVVQLAKESYVSFRVKEKERKFKVAKKAHYLDTVVRMKRSEIAYELDVTQSYIKPLIEFYEEHKDTDFKEMHRQATGWYEREEAKKEK